jgi:hypothetical protein
MFHKLIRFVLPALLLAATTGALLSNSASADHRNERYWTNHWNWYDGTFRPYYRNYYRSYPQYGYYDNWYGNRYRPYTGGYYYEYPSYQGERYQLGPLTIEHWH